MARPKTIDKEISGRDRTKDIQSFTLEPLKEVPQPKDWYGKFQREFFIETCEALIEAKQLRSVDIVNVEIAAWWYDVARNAMEKSKDGNYFQSSKTGWEQVSVHLSALEKASKNLQAFSDRYGTNLTSVQKIPKARSDKNSLSDMFTKK